MRLSEACLEAPDVGKLGSRVHLCGDGFTVGSQVGVRKELQALLKPQLGGWGVLLRGVR